MTDDDRLLLQLDQEEQTIQNQAKLQKIIDND